MNNPQPVKHPCPWWLLFLFDNPIRKMIHDPGQILAGYVHPGDVVLDVGCGMGAFTLDLARMVGSGGKVIAADVQPQMLAGLRRRAERAGLLECIQLLQAEPERIGISQPLDFALAFWMVHETQQPAGFLGEIYAALKPGGCLLIVEPRLHVGDQAFEGTILLAQQQGFRLEGRPAVKLSQAAALIHP